MTQETTQEMTQAHALARARSDALVFHDPTMTQAPKRLMAANGRMAEWRRVVALAAASQALARCFHWGLLVNRP